MNRSKLRPFWLGLVLLGVWSAPTLVQAAPEKGASSRWENQIAVFEATDKKVFPASDATLFIGSSSIRLWENLATDFPEIPVIRRGFGGSHLSDSTHFFERIVKPYKPRLVVLYAGGNDLAAGKTPAQVFADFQGFQAKLHAAFPQTRLVYISINPSIARWNIRDKTEELNRLIADFAQKQKRVSFINSYSAFLGPDGLPQRDFLRGDGLHLNTQGYKTWLAVLKPQILKFYAETTPQQ